MSEPNELVQELATLVKETGETIADDCYFALAGFLAELNLFGIDWPIPLSLWVAIAQAFADASGYRVILQAATLEPSKGDPMGYSVVGQREVASAEPTVFGKRTPCTVLPSVHESVKCTPRQVRS